MVQAILDDRKRQTRRIVRPQPVDAAICAGKLLDTTGHHDKKDIGKIAFTDLDYKYAQYVKLPFEKGDIMYVRETWFKNYYHEYGKYFYRADGETIQIPLIYGGTSEFSRTDGLRWKPSIHMPREAARIFLRVTDIQIERIQDITDESMIGEGIWEVYPNRWHYLNPCELESYTGTFANTSKQAFMWLWNHVNAKQGYGWAVNPWVWAYEFERCEESIT